MSVGYRSGGSSTLVIGAEPACVTRSLNREINGETVWQSRSCALYQSLQQEVQYQGYVNGIPYRSR